MPNESALYVDLTEEVQFKNAGEEMTLREAMQDISETYRTLNKIWKGAVTLYANLRERLEREKEQTAKRHSETIQEIRRALCEARCLLWMVERCTEENINKTKREYHCLPSGYR